MLMNNAMLRNPMNRLAAHALRRVPAATTRSVSSLLAARSVPSSPAARYCAAPILRRSSLARAYSTSDTSALRPCAGCHFPTPTVAAVCPQCARPQPYAGPSLTTHFDLLASGDLTYSSTSALPLWQVDQPAVRTRFLATQRAVHPDKFTGDADLHDAAAAQSNALNNAYGVVKDDLSRAEYILGLLGVEVAEDAMPVDDPEILMFVMETREAIDEAASHEELDGIQAEVQDAIDTAMADLDAAFAELPNPLAVRRGDADPVDLDSPGVAAARDATSRMSYFRNMLTAIGDRRESLE
ncbi:hypothetical protein H9P43_006018 [Blastocladiella emersonii ATCC 22665]|nr:hypothetical protein H9P43_006018 [Blastocladiella emersonii ATCC 22665]